MGCVLRELSGGDFRVSMGLAFCCSLILHVIKNKSARATRRSSLDPFVDLAIRQARQMGGNHRLGCENC
ncbi:hypothetical protein BDP67DRAFT_622451 [Colletotrichum lupini]|nr:hypothetical protein BDP67DRAFT_622451 [Colletotrichum lupini]